MHALGESGLSKLWERTKALIPTKVSAFTNDSGYLTEHQDISGKLDKSALLNMVYPVGSIYMSVNSADPSTFIGGTWTRLQDRFLLGAGSTYSAGGTGGAATHNHEYGLKVYEYYNMAAFNPKGTLTGAINIDDGSMGTWSGGSSMAGTETMNGGVTASAASAATNPHHYESRANTSTENNMPPYLAVYMWKRTV